MCIAAIFRNYLSKRCLQWANHNRCMAMFIMSLLCKYMSQNLKKDMLVDCDWWISLHLVCLAWWKISAMHVTLNKTWLFFILRFPQRSIHGKWPRNVMVNLVCFIAIFALLGYHLLFAHGICQKFSFFIDKDVVYNHALEDHVFKRSTVGRATQCHMLCKEDCRCISMNFMQNIDQDNCELNDVNKEMKPAALKYKQGTSYYDLVREYTNGVSDVHGYLKNEACMLQTFFIFRQKRRSINHLIHPSVRPSIHPSINK